MVIGIFMMGVMLVYKNLQLDEAFLFSLLCD